MLTGYLYSQLHAVFWLVVVIAAAVFVIAAVYFEREALSDGIGAIEERP